MDGDERNYIEGINLIMGNWLKTYKINSLNIKTFNYLILSFIHHHHKNFKFFIYLLIFHHFDIFSF